MEKKFFRASFGMRQWITLAPSLIMVLVCAGIWIFGGEKNLGTAGAFLVLMAAFWLGMGLWRIITEGCVLEAAGLVIVSGPQKIMISYDSIFRVMAGDVTLPGNRMARGALLIEQEGAARGQIIYPRDIQALTAELKKRAPEAIYITTAKEYEAVKKKAKKAK